MKLWEKNYKLDKKVEKYTVGNDYILDKKLVKYDCLASIAHAKMLEKINILTKKESENLQKELGNIIELDKKGLFHIKQEDEDCHTAIENYLIGKLGDAGKKIHTARSRNDQVLTALRLYYKDEIEQITKLINNLIKSISKFKEKYGNVNLPGYTHMRKAMPSSINLWSDAFIESMQDNAELMNTIHKFIDKSPLGTGAGYGIPLNFDRKFTANLLDFNKIQKNPLYVQNSRGKFGSLILEGLSQIMIDLNKISSDIILFSMSEFGFIKISSKICTGSSIRANYHKIILNQLQIKSMIANLISGYHRDFQLTKEPMINSLSITKESLDAMKVVFENLKVDPEKCKKAMTKELFATKEMYKLVENGIPFRDAYKKTSGRYGFT
jgi:argininosuccinate lyase